MKMDGSMQFESFIRISWGRVEIVIEEVGDGLSNIEGLSSLLIVYVLEHSGDVNSSCGPFFRIESTTKTIRGYM